MGMDHIDSLAVGEPPADPDKIVSMTLGGSDSEEDSAEEDSTEEDSTEE